MKNNMKKEENMNIEIEKKLSEINFETITDDELSQIFGGVSREEVLKLCYERLGKWSFQCEMIP